MTRDPERIATQNQRNPARRANRLTGAFTLVELLFVFGIIGILAALLLVALNRGVGKARQAQCAHNLGQLGSALQTFRGDNHEYPLVAIFEYTNGTYPKP